ncbi:protein TonB [Dyadobacter sp. BE34]|uniref:Protein TonB n=1 Tax=Dyadobacter fermentans TaxID=94254 RepID=A0ABU1QV29_9BACT|nr:MULTISPECIES: TonB family protein [Dyadobacter]MDR6804160.1 protein TonB [Dyadobacter fermentans]MDR7041900.1 protein TonB [Dyadobacter sp. BE242]MDR7196303.1 protein TonB [Dyadobacter sp. BE34]MDR7213152.1 protein TonB [Dyadobacter sp. BE31]MDR7261709.1 protein TonB [Dyadobacter sp. BE32]
MKRLQENRIDQISKYLQANKLDPELLPEILDHLACEAEESLWDGKPFEQIYQDMVKTADAQTLLNLSVDHQNLLAMEKSLNDIVFENRNKSYGAYDLRKGYGQTVQRAVVMGVAFFLLLVMFPQLYAKLIPDPKPDDIAYIVEAKPVDIVMEEPPAPPPAKEELEPVQKTVKSLTPEVLPDDKVEIEELPPVVEDLSNAQPSTETADGVADLDVIVPPVENAVAPKEEAAGIEKRKEETFTFVEQSPQYAGGNEAMAAFLRKNLKYPRPASQAGIQGKVFVQFTVGSDGKIENAAAVKGIGFGCDEEAVRVVKMMKDWMPGKQAGVPVRVRFTLPIAFQLD